MVSLFFSQHNGLFPPSTLLIVIFWVIFWVSSLPVIVTTHSNFCLHTNYFAERSYCRHIPPLGSLLMDSSSAVAMTPLMATDLAVTPHLYPLLLLLAAHLSKFVLDHYTMVTRCCAIRPGSLYDGAALIAQEDGSTLWASVRLQSWCLVRLGMGGGVQFFVGHQGGLKTDQLYYRLGSIFQ